MKVLVRVFPSAGLCDTTREMGIVLEEGNMGELETILCEQLGVNRNKIESLMFLRNGSVLDKRKNAVLSDGDNVWLLPVLSGG